MIITSVTSLAGLGQARLLPLQAFGKPDAVDLLATFVGHRATDDPEAAVKIVDACDGLPLAISVVGARLRRRPERSLGEAAALFNETLETIDDPKESVRATLSAGLAGLSADARRILLLIAALDLTDLSSRALAAVSGVPPRDARRVIEELEDRQLLAASGLHQLVRLLLLDLASEELTEDDLLSARDRRVQWLVTSAQPHISDLTGSVVPLDLAAERAALDWFEERRGELFSSLDQARSAEDWSQVAELAATFAPFLQRRSYWNDGEQVMQWGVEAAESLGDRSLLARLLDELGNVHRQQARWSEAAEEFRIALDLYMTLGDPVGQAHALSDLGLVERKLGRQQQAGETFRRSIRLWDEMKGQIAEADRLRGLARSLNNLGMVLRDAPRL